MCRGGKKQCYFYNPVSGIVCEDLMVGVCCQWSYESRRPGTDLTFASDTKHLCADVFVHAEYKLLLNSAVVSVAYCLFRYSTQSEHLFLALLNIHYTVWPPGTLLVWYGIPHLKQYVNLWTCQTILHYPNSPHYTKNHLGIYDWYGGGQKHKTLNLPIRDLMCNINITNIV